MYLEGMPYFRPLLRDPRILSLGGHEIEEAIGQPRFRSTVTRLRYLPFYLDPRPGALGSLVGYTAIRSARLIVLLSFLSLFPACTSPFYRGISRPSRDNSASRLPGPIHSTIALRIYHSLFINHWMVSRRIDAAREATER